jgi:hypothetical protein
VWEVGKGLCTVLVAADTASKYCSGVQGSGVQGSVLPSVCIELHNVAWGMRHAELHEIQATCMP